jgi:hypothetical protein
MGISPYGINVDGQFNAVRSMLTAFSGTKAADLPVQNPIKLKLVVNLKAAKRWDDYPRDISAPTRMMQRREFITLGRAVLASPVRQVRSSRRMRRVGVLFLAVYDPFPQAAIALLDGSRAYEDRRAQSPAKFATPAAI